MSKLGKVAGIAAAALMLWPNMVKAETIRIAFIDPLSGTFAALGENELRSFQLIGDIANENKWADGYNFEFVGFDNKASPQESLVQLQKAIDQGFRYITQANGSGAALALIGAIEKHNVRNPGKEVVFLNHGAQDPTLTNQKCSFWHFRFDADADMKTNALVAFMLKNARTQKVYLINQDYAAGHQFAAAAKKYLAKTNIEIVGNDLFPLGQVKDFSPYVAKIKASGADSVIAGSWGTDLTLLIKAAKDAGLDVDFYTYYANLKGAPTAMGASGEDRIKNVSIWNINNETFSGKNIAEKFKAKYDDDFTWMVTYSIVDMVAQAVKKANSADPIKVAFALEGLKAKSLNGDVEMRASDHQIQQPLSIATWTKTNGKDVLYDQEKTGYGWKTVAKINALDAAQPTSCVMKRPAQK